MKAIVVDASSLLRSADQDRPEWAVALHDARTRSRLVAPSLIASEAGHVVHRKQPAAYGETVNDRAAVLAALVSGVEQAAPDAAHLAAAGALAESTGLSFYDAQYLALAHAAEALLVTEDRELRNVATRVLGTGRAIDLDGLRRLLAAA